MPRLQRHFCRYIILLIQSFDFLFGYEVNRGGDLDRDCVVRRGED